MMVITLNDLITEGIFEIRRELADQYRPFQEITKEIVIYDKERQIVFVGKDGKRTVFDKRFVTLLKKKFKEAEWFLSAPCGKSRKDARVLVGVLEKEHYLILTPIIYKEGK
jgi:hypothetical protein